MVIAILRALQQFEYCLTGFSILYREKALDLIHVEKACQSLTELSPAIAIGHKQNVGSIWTDNLIANVIVRTTNR